nr:uncharacterized protein LOC111427960 isoform X3 [Onthophagus taurus]
MDASVSTRRGTRVKMAPQKNTEEPVEAETARNLNGNKDGVEEDAGSVEKAPEVKLDEEKESPKKTVEEEGDEPKKVNEVKLPESSEAEESASSEVETEGEREVIEPEKKDDIQDENNMSVPEKQQLGKGKRARIPNKRYSDILISARQEKQKRIENGENAEQTEISTPSSTSSNYGGIVAVVKGTPRRAESPLFSSSKKRKVQVDLNNPNFLKPFEFGWKRELVYRATSDSLTKKQGDIYYYTPAGKKVRSMREVSENLDEKELTLDNFTFYKEPLGLDDPDKEIIRDAKLKIGGKEEVPVVEPPPKTENKRGTKRTAGRSTPEVVETPPKKNNSTTKAKPPAKTPIAKGKTKKKAVSKEDSGDLEMGTYPPNWTEKTAPTTTSTPAKKPGRWANKNKSPTTLKPSTRSTKRSVNAPEKPPSIIETSKIREKHLQDAAYFHGSLLYVFQYLKVQDLLRAGCVCKMWSDIANHRSLWRTVRMKNSQICSFDGLAETLKKHGTVHLDLRKTLIPADENEDRWTQFSDAIKKADSLRQLELCKCPANVIEKLAESNPKLEVLTALAIKCEKLSLQPLLGLENLRELKLRGTNGLVLTTDLNVLKDLKNLKSLTLTSIKDLHNLNLSVLGEMSDLECLELGECSDLPTIFGTEVLSKLNKLEKLRLEKGQGSCHIFEILDVVKNMPKLEQLELVNFDIKSGFDKALGACKNIKKLLIIPTYISQSATTNHMVLGAVLRLQNTLTHFVWGVTLELLRVTELFVDQCEDTDKKEKKDKKPIGNGDSIPVLKPVPLQHCDLLSTSSDSPQVEILPLPNLQKLLLANLPSTRVKILKIPFHATWRQTLQDAAG